MRLIIWIMIRSYFGAISLHNPPRSRTMVRTSLPYFGLKPRSELPSRAWPVPFHANCSDRDPAWRTHLSRVLARNVIRELTDGVLLVRDDPLHLIANGKHAHDLSRVHDREMANASSGHDSHTFIDLFLRSHEDYRARHDVANCRGLRSPPLEDHFASVITF